MNTPNKLTLLRMALVPVFVLFLELDFTGSLTIATIIFIGASLTDMLDGKIARKHGLITNFGKFLDPLADKLLVTSALVCLAGMGFYTSWIVALIIAREFLVTSLRLVASDKGVVIAASNMGKLKTVTQMVAIITTLLYLSIAEFGIVIPYVSVYQLSNILIIIAAIFTVISGWQYLWAGRQFILEDK